VNLVFDFLREPINEAIASSIRATLFYAEPGKQGIDADDYSRSAGQIRLIEQAILDSLVSSHALNSE